MLALYRSGRQAEALEAYQDARRALVDELGIDPSRELRELEQAILRQDPALDPETAKEAGAARRSRNGPSPLSPPNRGRTRARSGRRSPSCTCISTLRPSTGTSSTPRSCDGVLTRAFGEVTSAVEAHGGTIETTTGDAVTAIFGVPVVHEDDPVRAARAAEEIQRRLADGEGGARTHGPNRSEHRPGVHRRRLRADASFARPASR